MPTESNPGDAYRSLIKQTVQLVSYGNFTYRDLLSMEVQERVEHYKALIETKEEEKKQTEKSTKGFNPGKFKTPSVPNVNRFKPPKIR